MKHRRERRQRGGRWMPASFDCRYRDSHRRSGHSVAMTTALGSKPAIGPPASTSINPMSPCQSHPKNRAFLYLLRRNSKTDNPPQVGFHEFTTLVVAGPTSGLSPMRASSLMIIDCNIVTWTNREACRYSRNRKRHNSLEPGGHHQVCGRKRNNRRQRVPAFSLQPRSG